MLIQTFCYTNGMFACDQKSKVEFRPVIKTFCYTNGMFACDQKSKVSDQLHVESTVKNHHAVDS